MATRERRKHDWESLVELKQRCSRFDFRTKEGVEAPAWYEVSFTCRSYIYDRTQGRVVLTDPDYVHKAEIFLDSDYPIKPPRIEWKTEIFHPNIHPKYTCILGGLWDPERPLADICVQLFEMVQFNNYDPKSHVREKESEDAADWVRSQPEDVFPADKRPIYP